jgi:hypothetical protein
VAKPVLLVTRKLPEAIEARAARDYDARLNPRDALWATDRAEIARRAGEGKPMVRAGKWEGWAPTQPLGVILERKKLGILGFGRIGRELAAMSRGFRMEIHYRQNAQRQRRLAVHAQAR